MDTPITARPPRPYDGKEVFLRRPPGIQAMSSDDAYAVMAKFFKTIHMEPPKGFNERTLRLRKGS